ncbi:MAG: tail fiber protein [Nevskia sp.]|nr:tail fiber protein [Nevskia sp.]
MATPYVGEIRLFAGNFAPAGWFFCDGRVLAISDYEVLYTLIGTTYGGNGSSTFALPDLRSRVPIHQGQGPGLNNHVLGEPVGADSGTTTPATGFTVERNLAATVTTTAAVVTGSGIQNRLGLGFIIAYAGIFPSQG